MVPTPIDETRLKMSTTTLPLTSLKPVTRKVTLLRWMVRLYVAVEGLASIAIVFGLAFWLGLAIDWSFEPQPAVRVAMWALVLAATSYVTVRFLLSRTFRRLPNSSLALLLERNFPELGESLVTTIEASEHRTAKDSQPLGHNQLLQNTGQVAATAMRRIKLRHVFRFRPLLWKSGLAIALLLSIFAFASFQQEAFSFWLGRMQLGEAPWPRRVELTVIGFNPQDNRTVNVARDDDFELQVEASVRDGHVAPESIEIRYRLADGRRGRDTMTKVGEALVGRDRGQQFRYTFKNVVADLEFDLLGGDDRLRGLKLRVVERPQIIRMTFESEFPEYMQRAPQSIPVSGRVEVPEGTAAQCRVQVNKALKQVTVHDLESLEDLPCIISTATPKHFNFDVKTGSEDRVLLISMLDHEGVANREPYRVVVSTIPDQPPEVSVQLRGISSAITPQATIPFFGQVTDEYGIEASWFEYQIDKEVPQERPLAIQPSGRRKLTELGHFDLAANESEPANRRVALQPGQQLTLSLKARDAYNLQQEAHVGSSQRFLLDVVTSSELRALLEKRELGLRQRFEAIYEKMLGTTELLARIEVEPAKQSEELTDTENSNQEDLERRQERDRLRISGALQNVTQLAHETLGVADGFEEIVRELTNNRVDTEELKQRLERGIADPLREIASSPMPELEEILQKFESALHETESSKKWQATSVAQAELVSEEMKQVLDRMLELESYNELVELLREIVDEQKQLEEQTKKQRREKLRSLLDDE